MYRHTLRSTPRAASALRQTTLRSAPRRFASTAPADKPRTWKGSALRWGLAGAAVYYYNTSPIFADEPAPRTVPAPSEFADSDFKTVDAVIEEKRHKTIVKPKETAPPAQSPAAAAATTQTSEAPVEQPTAPAPGSPEALEQEAGQQGAFNPETGEINWDCPCLGGMADGPCGEDFKAAFSCFVYSNEEPKGIDCIEKFQGMQDCFKKYPEIYDPELSDDREDEAVPAVDSNGDASHEPEAAVAKTKTTEGIAEKVGEVAEKTKGKAEEVVEKTKEKAEEVVEKTKEKVAEKTSPKKVQPAADFEPKQAEEALDVDVKPAFHDATAANDKVDQKSE